MSRLVRILLALAVLVVIAGAALWWFVLRDTAPKKLTLKNDSSNTATTTQGGSTGASAVAPGSLAGTWMVGPGQGEEATVAGYRVLEKFAGGVAKTTAAGRTPDATGSVTVVGDRVTAASITVDLTTLHSDRSQRDAAIRGRGLETNTFPKAAFVLSEPVTLPSIQSGKVFDVTANGKLTLHGVTRDVAIPLKAKDSGDRFIVQGSTDIQMADYRIDPPNVGGFVSVDGNGQLEFLLAFSKA